MNLDRFTNKAQEAVTACRPILSRFGHNQVTPEHLLLSLIEQQDGLAERILDRLEVKKEPLVEALNRYLAGQPKGSAVSMAKDEIHVSPKLVSVFDAAGLEAERLKDQYISVEHLLLALCDESKSQSGTLLKQ